LNSTPRRFLGLLPVAVLTLILTLLLSRGEGVRAMLQASPISTPTPFVPTVPPPGAIEQPTVGEPTVGEPTLEPFMTLEPPTSVPLPATVGPTPTVRGFLPAPTIVNPNDLHSLPLAQPQVSGGGAASEPTLVPAPAAGTSTARAAVALINYLWLLCGGVLLIGGAVAILLVWRRGQHT
jgi:hypothetical protein